MADVWFISDTHFGHKNVLKFELDGKPLREFESIWEMEQTMYERWCEVVKPQDKIYHLGDVGFTQDSILRMRSLPGHKRLVMGNHDKFQTKLYMSVFEQLYGVRQIDRFWISHIPMHVDSVDRYRLNIHGHTHARKVLRPDMKIDTRYFNTSVECIDYRPIHFDEIKTFAKKHGR